MISFPNCKINLGLQILRKRNDGFHDIETVFYPVKIFDALEIISSQKGFQFTQSGLKLEDDETNNLCVKAYDLIKNDFPGIGGVKMHLHKSIPAGSGLGGGSSDAALTLKLLNKKFALGLSKEKMLDYALRLGSDCPFFIINKPALATGRGEFLETIRLDLSSYKFLIVNPGIHVSTGWAFANTIPVQPTSSINEIIQQPIETWKESLRNVFEETVFNQYPEIKKIKEELYKAGAIYSAMSGSGSSVYGIFPKQQIQHNFPPNYYVRESSGQA